MGLPSPRSILGLPFRAVHETVNVGILARSGVLAPARPDRLAQIGALALRWGASPATPVLLGAVRHPRRPVVHDEAGTLTYEELDAQSNAFAQGLAGLGHDHTDRVALLCRDHRFFLIAMLGAAKLGADVLLLNTSFAAPQLAGACEREGASVLVYDEEMAGLVADAPVRTRILGWTDSAGHDAPAVAELVRACSEKRPSPPPRTPHITLLTSGTTGTPKGASRGASNIRTLDPAAGLLERIPYRAGRTTCIAAPLFHGWGAANLTITLALGGTVVLRRRFHPERCLEDIVMHECDVLAAVPVMLQRILDLPDAVRAEHPTPSLETVVLSGSALPADLATRWMDEYGDSLHNLYGSTEVAFVAIATPADLRAAPQTAGRPARGCRLRLFDAHGLPVPPGESGRIFVGNGFLFEGYTGGGTKEVIDGMMSTGDVGRFDDGGRLFVEGRDDEMIVSGGENVFPKEVEDVLAMHPDVLEAAAVGVPDPDFGQRLKAWVVLRDGAELDEAALQAHVRSELARFKVPREIVGLDALPRNPTGKVLKRELA